MRGISIRFGLQQVTEIAKELGEEISKRVTHIEKSDIIWVLKEILGNVRHSPTEIGTVCLLDDCTVRMVNCAIGNGETQAERHGFGRTIAQGLGANVSITFNQSNCGCWEAVTTIRFGE